MNKKKNFITAIVCQLVTICYGLIVPRIVLVYFGSVTNGLISSITQFLNFISLLEGGLGAVVLSELYKPLENNDQPRIKEILYSSRKLFRILGFIYIGFSVLVAFIYPFFVKDSFDFGYVCLLTLILSLGTMSQYVFSITNRLFLQAQQKVFIVNIVSSITLIANIIIAVVCVNLYPEVHVLKLATSICFFIQPIIYSRFINKDFKDLKGTVNKGYVLKNRWSGFGQNLAHFINMNTDIIVVTVFLGLTNVSIYATYLLAISALRNLVSSINDSFQSAYGKYYVEDYKKLKTSFNHFKLLNDSISLVLFMSCLLLINQFVHVYTLGINDASYYEPTFAFVIILATLAYCVREPFRLVVLAAGKFRETNFGSFAEALINISVSLVLVNFLGLTGIALGTLIATVFRFGYLIWYLKKDVLFYNFREYIENFIKICVVVALNVVAYYLLDVQIENFLHFFLYGMVVFSAEVLLVAFVVIGPKKSIDLLRNRNIKGEENR